MASHMFHIHVLLIFSLTPSQKEAAEAKAKAEAAEEAKKVLVNVGVTVWV